MLAKIPKEKEPEEDVIPTYRIDLSLPPAKRYCQLAIDFGPQMRALKPLLDEVLKPILPYAFIRRFVEFLASIALRRVYSREETQELRGISKVSGVDMYFLVALNVLLDSFLGCTSGAARVRPSKMKEQAGQERMMHFRTLDWGMDELRSVIVTLEFVKSKSANPDKVIARSVTYAGFVGCLTGLRERLSVSLNFRPYHSCSTAALRLHQVLVLFGFRPSIVSVIRSTILPNLPDAPLLELADLKVTLAQFKAPPCYLILCDGHEAIVIERDFTEATIYGAKDLIVCTNHDSDSPSDGPTPPHLEKRKAIPGMQEFIEDSGERREFIECKWRKEINYQRSRKAKKGPVGNDPSWVPTASEGRLRRWLRSYPTMNECTHFACILDPSTCEIRWLKRGMQE